MEQGQKRKTGTAWLVVGTITALLAIYGLITANYYALVFWGIVGTLLLIKGFRQRALASRPS